MRHAFSYVSKGKLRIDPQNLRDFLSRLLCSFELAEKDRQHNMSGDMVWIAYDDAFYCGDGLVDSSQKSVRLSQRPKVGGWIAWIQAHRLFYERKSLPWLSGEA